jgi:hypothetical protein
MISSYTSWQPLRECVVGRVYPSNYFDHIQVDSVRKQLDRILDETEQDLDNLAKIIREFGAVVHRPSLPDKDLFQELQIRFKNVAPPPLTPRDHQITFGNRLLRLLPLPELDSVCDDALAGGGIVINPHMGAYDPDCVVAGAVASCILRVGTDVFFDNSDWMTPAQSQWIVENILGPDYRIHEAVTDGHGDAVFAILKPGVILTTKHDDQIDLQKEFPGWEVLRLWDSSIDACMRIGQFKEENFNGRWYLHDETPTDEFRNYVDQYLNQWTGLVSETIFDVNCLVLDEQHVIFSSHNPTVAEFCRRHHITPIVAPLRHQYFWDGGISCCTQDIRREGGLETYL